jgi:arsenate reductase
VAAKKNLLFLCMANSVRSQMAEGLARHLLGAQVTVQSAGLSPSSVSRYAVASLAELDIDISGQQSKSVFKIKADSVDTVITLCSDPVCPPGLLGATQLHWPVRVPESYPGDLSESYARVRDEIDQRLRDWAVQEGLQF